MSGFLRLPPWAAGDAEAGGGSTSNDLVTLQLWFPQGFLPCQDEWIMAQLRQYWEFDFTDKKHPTMRVPGYNGGHLEWVKDAPPSKQ